MKICSIFHLILIDDLIISRRIVMTVVNNGFRKHHNQMKYDCFGNYNKEYDLKDTKILKLNTKIQDDEDRVAKNIYRT